MKLNSYISILLAVLFMAGCRPEPLEINLPTYEPKVVVASQVLPGEIMFIGLTRSFTVLSDAGVNGEGDSTAFDNILVDSALVTIEHSGEVDTLVKFASGLYGSLNTLDDPGTFYTLKVKDYLLNTTVSASTEMLTKLDFDTVYPVVETGDDTLVTIHAKFTDEPGVTNYYMVNVYSREALNNGLDLNSFFDNGSNKVEATRIYTDADFENDQKVIEIEMYNMSPDDSIAVTLSNISPGYYEFLQKRQKSGNIFAEITNEPINYPSNVTGGLGFFNTHFPDVEYFDLNEY